jgi:hypothetical protein
LPWLFILGGENGYERNDDDEIQNNYNISISCVGCRDHYPEFRDGYPSIVLLENHDVADHFYGWPLSCRVCSRHFGVQTKDKALIRLGCLCKSALNSSLYLSFLQNRKGPRSGFQNGLAFLCRGVREPCLAKIIEKLQKYDIYILR